MKQRVAVPRLLLTLALAAVILGLAALFPRMNYWKLARLAAATITPTASQTVTSPPPTFTATTTSTTAPTTQPTAESESNSTYPDGLIILSMTDGYYRHLFAYHPFKLTYTRLTNHPWDDIQPAISPDGSRLAYTSKRNGFWDIYIYDLTTAQSIRLTDSPAYDGNPSWSPDGQWLAYDSYQTGNLDIFIQSVADLTQPPIQLTDDSEADYDPAWSPAGSTLAFTSLRTGEPEIWLALLDQNGNRFVNFTSNSASADSQAAWAPDGQTLAWTSTSDGTQNLKIASSQPDGKMVHTLGAGSAPLWNPSGKEIYSQVVLPDGFELVGYNSDSGLLILPPVPLPGQLSGTTWNKNISPERILGLQEPDSPGPASLLDAIPITQSTDPVTGRAGLVPLLNVNAPYAYLSDAADETFSALRGEIARLSGWDVLANLQNAYLPITSPSLSPVDDDWLRTGLGIAINPLPYQAGWMAVQREDLNGEVFWRLYIKARFQDGSQGEPIFGQVWDLNARSSSSPADYEQGGAYANPPSGYWIDFTELAARFGWQRLPAYSNWRTFFSSARFNEFAFIQGMDWDTAMRQLYPAELVHIPTPVPTLTLFPTITPQPLNRLTATAQAGSRQVPTTISQPRPTWTPYPEAGFP